MIAGGISRLFSTSGSLPSSTPLNSMLRPVFADDAVSSLRHDRSDDFSSSFSFSSKTHDPSPVSVFHGPVSCSRSPQSSRGSSDWFGGSDLKGGRERLLGRFVTNALRSCLDYDSPLSMPVPVGGGIEVDDLGFSLEEEESLDSTALGCESYAKELLSGAQRRHKIFCEEFVVKAFYEAEKAHRGQMRATGDPYLQHCVETALFLANVGASAMVVAAGLLHDALDDSFMDYNYILRSFGAGVADLVDGVTKLSQLSKLARENNIASKRGEADRLHTMFLAMADARAVLIKLADRLHNMMTLDSLPMAKQQRFAKETLEIFAPLANRLGIFSWKEQLENLCFKHLHPEEHNEISSRLVESFDESIITNAIKKLEKALRDWGVSYHVLSGRHKSLYSIYSKMLKKKLAIDDIHDIYGLRLIVENETDCYIALNVVHQLWLRSGKFKDYIVDPKCNGYRSLHTVVSGEGSVPLEVQIRTKEMHLQAELGFAAHWRYKEGDSQHSSFVLQMVEWARWVLSWQCETMKCDHNLPLSTPRPCSFPLHEDGCPYSYTRRCFHSGPVFVVMLENEKMSVQELPSNTTLEDLLEKVGKGSSRWSAYTFPLKEELRPRLNGEPVVDPRQKLKMGDVVELTPAIPEESLTVYREEIQRMYNRDALAISGRRQSRTT